MTQSAILAIDLGARHLGWASRDVAGIVRHDFFVLPGIADPGTLFGLTRNCLDELVARFRPGVIRFAPAFIAVEEPERPDRPGKPGRPKKRRRTSVAVMETSLGQQAILKMTAWDNDCILEPLNERMVRKRVLGQCDFALVDERTGGLIPESGRAEAKRVVMEWCASRSFMPASHDVGDALVLLHYEPEVVGIRRARNRQQRSIF